MSNDNRSSINSSTNIQNELGTRILNVIDEVDKGFKTVMFMYTVAFYVGLGLIVFSFLGTLYFEDNIFLLVFGGAGLADIVAFFIFKPAEDLQRSRGNLAQLVSAFLTWYNDAHNWNQFLEKELRNQACEVGVFKEVSKTSMINTVTIMSAIELFVASKLPKNADEKLKTIIKDIEDRIDNI